MSICQFINRSNNLLWQVVRYGIVGSISTGIHYGFYLLLLFCFENYGVQITLNANISYAGGYLIAFCANYLLTTYYTFKTKANKKNAAGFTISHIFNYFIEMTILNLLLLWNVEKSLAGLIVMIVAVPINFVCLKVSYYYSEKNGEKGNFME